MPSRAGASGNAKPCGQESPNICSSTTLTVKVEQGSSAREAQAARRVRWIVGLSVRRGTREDVERLEPLWDALREHHASLPDMVGVRSAKESWARRRAQYLEWLSGDDCALFVAERDGALVGYAVVSVEDQAAPTWALGDRTAEVETLSVSEHERSRGVGRALMEAASEFARSLGAATVLVGVAHTNAAAVRFYERQGFTPFYALMIRTDA
jgi:ribosomal protein S18 acetylase RimI-like enzyme